MCATIMFQIYSFGSNRKLGNAGHARFQSLKNMASHTRKMGLKCRSHAIRPLTIQMLSNIRSRVESPYYV